MVQCPGYAARFFDGRKEAARTAEKFAVNASFKAMANAYVYSADVDSYLPTYVGWLRCPEERKTLLLHIRAKDGEIVENDLVAATKSTDKSTNKF